jgi:hypothetical protein
VISKKTLKRIADDTSRPPEDRAAARAALTGKAPLASACPQSGQTAESVGPDHPRYAEYLDELSKDIIGIPPEMQATFPQWLAFKTWQDDWLKGHKWEGPFNEAYASALREFYRSDAYPARVVAGSIPAGQ